MDGTARHALHDKITRRTTAEIIYLIDQFLIRQGIPVEQVGGGWVGVVVVARLIVIGRCSCCRSGRGRSRAVAAATGVGLTFDLHAGAFVATTAAATAAACGNGAGGLHHHHVAVGRRRRRHAVFHDFTPFGIALILGFRRMTGGCGC